jgi:hypothetical protein
MSCAYANWLLAGSIPILPTASQHTPIAVYTQKYFLTMSSNPAQNMKRLIIEIK